MNDIDKSANLPNHVAIIMDGNGRWAKERGKPRIDGHIEGSKRISDVLSAASECGVKYLTLYAFSSENWNRPKDEVEALMDLLKSTIKEHGKDFLQNKIRFRTIGNISQLPKDCAELIDDLAERTKNFDSATLILALNYGSRDEICRAVKNIVKDASNKKISEQDIDWTSVSSYLDTAGIPDPDLMIRTSGEMRLSNYLMMQAAYAELYFTKTYWPDFDKEEFIKAVKEYQRRERRYGLTTDQLKK